MRLPRLAPESAGPVDRFERLDDLTFGAKFLHRAATRFEIAVVIDDDEATRDDLVLLTNETTTLVITGVWPEDLAPE
jgi:hypothetical protein